MMTHTTLWSTFLHNKLLRTADKPHVMKRHTQQTRFKMFSWLPEHLPLETRARAHTDTQTPRLQLVWPHSDLSRSLWFTYCNALTWLHVWGEGGFTEGRKTEVSLCLNAILLYLVRLVPHYHFLISPYYVIPLCLFSSHSFLPGLVSCITWPCLFNPLPHWTLTRLACVTSMITQLLCVCARTHVPLSHSVSLFLSMCESEITTEANKAFCAYFWFGFISNEQIEPGKLRHHLSDLVFLCKTKSRLTFKDPILQNSVSRLLMNSSKVWKVHPWCFGPVSRLVKHSCLLTASALHMCKVHQSGSFSPLQHLLLIDQETWMILNLLTEVGADCVHIHF